MHNYKSIVRESERRKKELFKPYDPVMGIGSPVPRFEVKIDKGVSLWLPEEMIELPWVKNFTGRIKLTSLIKYSYKNASEEELHEKLAEVLAEINRERIEYDFEFWCYTCVKIQDKLTKELIPFKLNAPQRKLLGEIWDMAMQGIPIRIILLKARQWGGSTMTQLLMAWVQNFKRKRWHSAIVTDVEDQARNVRGMYSLMADNHPAEIAEIKLAPFQGSSKNKMIKDRDSVIAIGSMQQPDNLRSFDFAMCHFSEVGLWKETKGKKPEDLIQAVRSTVPRVPWTMVVLESTAKGVGNYFHREWLDAVNGKSGYKAVFVAWFEIEMYQIPFPKYMTYTKFIDSMNQYEWFLWESGATLEGIHWYRTHKKSENMDDWRMQSEFPTNAIEAFASTGRRAFAPGYVLKAREYNRKPEFIGDIEGDSHSGEKALSNIQFVENSAGVMKIWAMPDNTVKMKRRYVVPVDIGGRTRNADFSVIRVIDRAPMLEGGVPEAVLTWRGHIDQDLVIWKSVQIAKIYGDGLLVPESNSLRKESIESEGDHIVTILDEIKDFYENIYTRTDPEKIKEGVPVKYGFHTNVKTKVALIDNLNKILREEGYIEPDSMVCDEYDIYEMKPDGTYGAVEGRDTHDDLVMCTAIGLKVSDEMEMPAKVEKKEAPRRKVINEATF